MRKKPILSRGRDATAEWEAALALRLRRLPPHRAPARLRRRILTALPALERETKAGVRSGAAG